METNLPDVRRLTHLFGFWVLSFVCTSDAMSSVAQKRPHVAVIGGGFGGWGAAKALCEAGCKVTLIDAGDPAAKQRLVTKTGKPFEAGHKGFWKDYPNMYTMISDYLGIQENEIFTPYTNSSFYSPFGLEATAPVFSSSSFPELPSPLGQIVASSRLFERLPVSDRLSMVGLLLAILDYTRDEKTYEAYDRMTAHELFIRFRLSKRLVDDFITPTLLVGLFKPPEELSAAIVMDLLYFYALAHQNSFDARWIKKGSITESIVKPLAERLQRDHDLSILDNTRVTQIGMNGAYVKSVDYTQSGNVEGKLDDVDACVLSVGSSGLRSIMSGSPALAKLSPELTRASSLGSVPCISVRLWLDTQVTTRSPANVFSRFAELRGSGGTFFMLDQLQGNTKDLWGGEEPQGSVVACDFYNSGGLMPLSDEDIVSLCIDSLLPAAVPGFAKARVVDSAVQKYPAAVTWFSPGSFKSRPPMQIKNIPNLVCAGDWVRLGDRGKHLYKASFRLKYKK